jgi:hypothetical protein
MEKGYEVCLSSIKAEKKHSDEERGWICTGRTAMASGGMPLPQRIYDEETEKGAIRLYLSDLADLGYAIPEKRKSPKRDCVRLDVMLQDESTGLPKVVLGINLVVNAGVDPVQAVKDACHEWKGTDEGKEAYEQSCRDYDWGDFANDGGNDAINQKHGFRVVDRLPRIDRRISVDNDEQLMA